MSGIPNLKYKTSLCNSWKQGLPCQKGVFCFFAHGQEQLRSMEQNRQFLAQQNNIYVPPTSSKFKTTYCKFYSKGDCKLGQSCSFAHSKSEKRQKNYVQKSQMIPNLNLNYFPFYSSEYYSQYANQMQFMYQYDPSYSQYWNEPNSNQEQKSQDIMQNEDEKGQKIESEKKEQEPKDSPSE